MSFPTHKSPLEPGQQLAGKYRVEREIGAGAMGVVVEAWHIELDQRVAIKFLNPQFAHDEEAAERFRREARAAVRIESEHVARVLDIGMLEDGRIHYYVMEFLRGQDLARELAEQGSLPVTTAVDYMLQACDAVRKAHAQGIIHRDLKPANLFLAQRPNGERSIKVLDFGISKFTELSSQQFSITDTAALLGSPAYMSPEQLESSRNVDGRADIWSFGVILHELIVGEVPFQGESVLQLVRSVVAGDRPSLTSRAGVPLELERVVARCLRQRREERFASIEQLAEALAPFSSAHQRRVSGGTSTLTGVAQPSPVAHSVAHPASGAEQRPARGLAAAAAQRPAPHAQSEATSWGNTHRGRGWRQTIYRRGWLGVLIALALGAAAYFGRPWRERAAAPEAAAITTAAPAEASPSAPSESTSAAPEPPPAPAPPLPDPSTTPAPSTALTTPPTLTTTPALTAAPAAEPSRRPRVAAPERTGRRAADVTAPEKGASGAPPRKPEAEPAASSGASAGEERPTTAPPKPTPGLDIPDYGGRE